MQSFKDAFSSAEIIDAKIHMPDKILTAQGFTFRIMLISNRGTLSVCLPYCQHLLC